MRIEVLAHPKIEARLSGESVAPGSVIELPGDLARGWIRLGIGREVPHTPLRQGGQDETAVVEDGEKAVVAEPKGKRRKTRGRRKGTTGKG